MEGRGEAASHRRVGADGRSQPLRKSKADRRPIVAKAALRVALIGNAEMTTTSCCQMP